MTCECGSELIVPTIRGLNELESVEVEQPRRQGEWDSRRALMLLGGLLAVIGLGLGAYRQAFAPQDPLTPAVIERSIRVNREAVRNSNLEQLWAMWSSMKEGLDRTPIPEVELFKANAARNRRWMWVMYGVGAAGLALIAGGLAMRR